MRILVPLLLCIASLGPLVYPMATVLWRIDPTGKIVSAPLIDGEILEQKVVLDPELAAVASRICVSQHLSNEPANGVVWIRMKSYWKEVAVLTRGRDITRSPVEVCTTEKNDLTVSVEGPSRSADTPNAPKAILTDSLKFGHLASDPTKALLLRVSYEVPPTSAWPFPSVAVALTLAMLLTAGLVGFNVSRSDDA
jgi:hypothetical protein